MVFHSSIHLIFISGSGPVHASRVFEPRMFRMESAPVALPQIMVNLRPNGGTHQGRRQRLAGRFDNGNPTCILWDDGRILRKRPAIEQK